MANTYVYITQGTPTNNDKWTYSCWFKKCGNGAAIHLAQSRTGTSGPYFNIMIGTDNRLRVYGPDSGGLNDIDYQTTRVFFDLSAWYHLVVAFDNTLASAGDRMRIYINGVEETLFETETNPASGVYYVFNRNNYNLRIGARTDDTEYWNGYMSNIQFVDGLQLAPTEFGEVDAVSGVWKIKVDAYATPGNNGFFLKMEDSSNMDLDSSSNARAFSTSGTLTSATDNPSNNYPTFNPLTVDDGGAKTYTTGNNTVTETANSWTSAHSSIMAQKGKYYCETKLVSFSGGSASFVGAATAEAIQSRSSLTYFLGATAGDVGYYASNGNVDKAGASAAYGDTWGAGDIIGTALDIDNGFIYFSKNGVWQDSGDPTSGATGTGGVSLPSGMTGGELIGLSVSPNESVMAVNYGNGYFGTTQITSAGTNASNNGLFEYDVPTGYTALSTKGLDT